MQKFRYQKRQRGMSMLDMMIGLLVVILLAFGARYSYKRYKLGANEVRLLVMVKSAVTYFEFLRNQGSDLSDLNSYAPDLIGKLGWWGADDWNPPIKPHFIHFALGASRNRFCVLATYTLEYGKTVFKYDSDYGHTKTPQPDRPPMPMCDFPGSKSTIFTWFDLRTPPPCSYYSNGGFKAPPGCVL